MAMANLGLALLKAGRPAEALEVFRDVLARNPGHAFARAAVARLSRQ